MLCGRTENVALPEAGAPSSAARGTANAPNATSLPLQVPSMKLVRPMKPATKRVFGLL